MTIRKMVSLLGIVGCLLAVGLACAGDATQSDLDVDGHFTSSGVFVPTRIDTNGDGFGAGAVTEQINGKLKGTRLIRRSSMLEYTLTEPSHQNCFRVHDDFSVEENAYAGPLFELVSPIRVEPVASNSNLVPYAAENWTTFYQFESGELLYAKIDELQICVENVPKEVSPWPLCHIKVRETILGGTGRFRNATGKVVLNAIAPTATGNVPAFDHNGKLNMVFPTEVFLFGPTFGAGDIKIELPR